MSTAEEKLKIIPMRDCRGLKEIRDTCATYSASVMNFSTLLTEEGWRIQKMNRKTKGIFSIGIKTKNQESFL